MKDLTVTTTLERWTSRRRQQRFLNEGMRALAAGLVVGGGTVALVMWVPSLSFLLVPASMLVVALAGMVGWRMRHRLRPDAVAADVDGQAETEGLLRTALAVEGGRVSASREVGGIIRAQAAARLSELEPLGSPALQVPVGPTAIAGAAAVALSIVFAVALVTSTMRAVEMARLEDPIAFDDARAAELGAALAELDELAEEPGLDPLAKRDLELAREHMRNALAERSNPQASARALDQARRALQQMQQRPLGSAASLQAARPDDLAKGLNRALGRNDPGTARRLGEEVLRRVDGGATDGELRRLGKALTENVKDRSEAGGAAREAGRALQNAERGSALAALADLMASLGEPVRMEPRQDTLAEASEAVDQARQDALANMDQGSEGSSSDEGEQREGAGEQADMPDGQEGSGATPSPVESPQGGEGDGGGGTAKGGTEDLRDGGTPGPGGDPEVKVDGERPPGGRQDGPAAEGGRLVEGDGAAQDGIAPQDQPAGAGEGDAFADGGLASEDAGSGSASLVAGAGPAGEGGGQGEGNGGTIDVPLLELEPGTVTEEWVDLQWDGAGEAMGQVLDAADAGGRTGMAWQEVHGRYGSLAESATRRSHLPLTRRQYVRRYFEAIRPTPEEPESP